MKEKVLPPIKDEKKYWDRLEEHIRRIFREQIYLPIAKDAKARLVYKNENENPLVTAIRSDKVHFSRGEFSGNFSAEISKALKKIGAIFDRRTGTFRIVQSKLPAEILHAVQASHYRFQQRVKDIDDKLSRLVPDEVADKLKAEKIFDTTLYKTDEKIAETLKGMIVSPKLSKDARAALSRDYNNNLKKYIADFTREETQELRSQIEKSVLSGNRADEISKIIQKRYDVSVNKAKFLARQETSIMLSKFKEVRYKDAGVNEYIWRCVSNPKDTSPDKHTPGNVRYYHGVLDKRKFTWDNPPITDGKSKRNNPGEDYNCRCTARPVVTF